MNGRCLLIAGFMGLVALVAALAIFQPSFDFLPDPEGKARDKFD